MTQALTTGTRVRMKAAWLKQIGTHPTDDLWRMVGTVIGSKKVGDKTLIRVLWEGEEEPKSSFPQYLQPVGTPEPI